MTFDEFWAREIKANSGVPVGADYRHWAKAGWDAAIKRERARLGLPKSYGGSTFGTWGDQTGGCTLRIHFTDAQEAEQWFTRLTDGWDISRSKDGT